MKLTKEPINMIIIYNSCKDHILQVSQINFEIFSFFMTTLKVYETIITVKSLSYIYFSSFQMKIDKRKIYQQRSVDGFIQISIQTQQKSDNIEQAKNIQSVFKKALPICPYAHYLSEMIVNKLQIGYFAFNYNYFQEQSNNMSYTVKNQTQYGFTINYLSKNGHLIAITFKEKQVNAAQKNEEPKTNAMISLNGDGLKYAIAHKEGQKLLRFTFNGDIEHLYLREG